jgi:hypothetical protein
MVSSGIDWTVDGLSDIAGPQSIRKARYALCDILYIQEEHWLRPAPENSPTVSLRFLIVLTSDYQQREYSLA